MSRSTWLSVLTLGGCLAVGTLWAADQAQDTAQTKAGAAQGLRDRLGTERQPLHVIVDESADVQKKAAEDEARTQRNEGYTKADLDAQTRMAVAAEALLGLTDIQNQLTHKLLIATAVEITFLIGTFAAAAAAVVVAAGTGRHQLRAYIGILPERAQTRPGGAPLTAQVPIVDYLNGRFIYKNHGQTPARNVISYHIPNGDHPAWEFRAVPFPAFPDKKFLRAQVDAKVSTVTMNPGQEYHFLPGVGGTGPHLTIGEVNSLNHGTVAAFFRGVIKYEDIFGTSHYTYFCFSMSGEYDMQRCAWSTVDEHGNEAD